MTEFEYDCYALACTLEKIAAKERLRGKGARFRGSLHAEYDPHAATELGSLIYNRLKESSRKRAIMVKP